MTTEESTEATEPRSRAVRWRPLAIAVYAAALVAWIVVIGVPTDPFQMFAWMWLAVIAWRWGVPARAHLDFVKDWWPAFAVLVVYLYSRGLSDELIGTVHWTMPIHVDRWLTGGNDLPTAYLQDALCGDPCVRETPPRWYDVLLTTVYYTHFVVALTLALVLWVRNRVDWAAWLSRYLVMNVAGLIVYVLYPMAPPWLASKEGYIAESLPRLTGRGWSDLGLGGFHVILAKVGNPVAAMPSLHGGIAMLVALWTIRRLTSPWRWTALIYPLVMAFALVYYAEHYVIDIIAGWALAGLVMFVVGRWERRRGVPI
ncbi:phosphatase PAP2 family protein [Aeromicrobium sp. 636]|uniref:Inositol phosphorylceramide synthase n=1 Tax=Aeromicrobium senzhongii TaxID=2663859 RepID=A0A8I0ETK7_9ACTN|nr:phosphatase PAP2 family protein [Aeromicrobium sp. 636]MBC9225945.1 inositol phosphorylceramide synthase [Aeromicrobium senzhongii]MCQ3998052.1 phosphatase PAP2 family protein [Aeromicrobium sp. 636]